MTGYENVAVRQNPMKTSAKLRAAGGAKLRSKQRKWRVILAIGLLLPALAAIIGIVAWAISVEVASGGGGPTNYRKPQQLQLQQQQQSSLYHQFRRQAQQQQQQVAPAERDLDARLPVAAAVLGGRPASARRRSEREEAASGAQETKSESGARLQQQQQVVGRAKSGQTEVNEQGQASSALLLTNLGQVEALSGSTSTRAPTTSTSAVNDIAMNEAAKTEQALADEPSTENEAAELQQQQADRQRPGVHSNEAHDRDNDRDDGYDEDASEQQQSAGASQVRPAPAKTRRPLPGEPATTTTLLVDPAKSEGHKSRWSSERANNKRPIKVSANGSLAAAKDGRTKLSGAHKRPLVESSADSRRKQLASRLSKARISLANGSQASNRYVLLDRPSEEVEEELEGGERPPSSTNTGVLPERSGDSTSAGSGDDSTNANQANLATGGREPVAAVGQEDELSFEAIASAISTTLSAANNAQLAEERSAALDGGESDGRAPAEGGPANAMGPLGLPGQGDAPAEGDTGALANDQSANEAPADSNKSPAPEEAVWGERPQAANQLRRRTAGEHVAEVIDHIVERRKQQSPVGRLGPQIVVVAPVGGDQMRARSLTKAAEQPDTSASQVIGAGKSAVEGANSKTAIKKQPVVEDKRIVSSVKKEALLASNADKKASSRRRKPIGARLIGGSTPAEQSRDSSSDQIKFSERVEVIEDDDSSAFLGSQNLRGTQPEMSKQLAKQHERSEEVEQTLTGDAQGLVLLDTIGEEHSSIHVSSQPGEPRSRSPRHESAFSFERYGRQFAAEQQQPQSAGNQPKLYSAEQLIRDHVLKSKLKPKLASSFVQQPQAAFVDQKRPADGGLPIDQPLSGSNQQQQFTPVQQVKVPPTTLRPHIGSPSSVGTSEPNPVSRERQPAAAASRQQQSAGVAPISVSSRQERLLPGDQQQQAQASSIQSVQVPVFIQQQQQQQHQQQHKIAATSSYQASGPAKQVDTYQALESQQSSVQYQQPAQSQQQQLSNDFASQQQNEYQQQQQVDQQQQQASSLQSSQQQQVGQQQNLPVFADQEYNVPAHMAESVIQDIQRSPPTIGMVNNQPTLVSLADQVPYLQHQQQQQQLQYQPAGSNQQALYRLASQQQAWQNQAAAANLLARLANVEQQEHYLNQQQQQQQQQSQTQRQVLANRNGIETPARAIRNGIVHPVAQLALRHLLNSLGQQQASAYEAAAKQSAPGSSANEIRARSMAANNNVNQISTDIMQGASSAPVSSAVLPTLNGAVAPLTDSGATGRSMRSLPIGDKLEPAASQDQEVQESYGQMPTYHMGGYGGGGGGGGGHHYGGDNYQSDHDKKSKGITFHFGGGPIGGGTQLITSPMGIFKHLMIPLLPNPRVNLNGKVVFGVVLEKSTAIGEPKKKYKFWGR